VAAGGRFRGGGAYACGPKPVNIGIRVDVESFQKNLRRSDYQLHKYWLVGAVLGMLTAFVLQSPYGFVLTGVCLIASGAAAIRGGKSLVQSIGVSSSSGWAGMSWSTRRLEEMSPQERVKHAHLTGGFVVLMGCGFLAMAGAYGWTQLSDHQAADRYEAMVQKAGMVSRAASAGRGVAASEHEVCWGGARGGALCSDSTLSDLPDLRSDFFQADELVRTEKGFVAASSREVTWLGGAGHMRTRLFARGGQALAALGTRVAWIANGDVMVVDLATLTPQAAPEVVAEVADTNRPLLALTPEAIVYGPTERCGLERAGSEGCIAPREHDICAVSASRKQLAYLTTAGELWRLTGEQTQFSRLPAKVSGCLLAVNDGFAYVAGAGPIMRVDLSTGSQATVFQANEAASAIALSDRYLYFRTSREVHGIELDAPGL